jgi:hypothetical protein
VSKSGEKGFTETKRPVPNGKGKEGEEQKIELKVGLIHVSILACGRQVVLQSPLVGVLGR